MLLGLFDVVEQRSTHQVSRAPWAGPRPGISRPGRSHFTLGVVNEITTRPRIKPHAIEQEISDAFQRNALLDAHQITVTSSDGTAHL